MTDNFFQVAPFKIYSSSVDTGYATEISASFKPGLDITNMKTDRYSDLNDAPAQSPFTYQYVGGSQFRHVPLNDGTDTPSTRPELFHISMSAGILKVIGPDSIDVSRPRAYYFRDTLAKRPINIANIQTSTGSTTIGNYTHDYDIIQTTGRTSNNRAFVEVTGSGFARYLTTMYVSGAKDPNRTLPNFDLTGTNSFVFVNHFNAPGGTDVSSRGVLDTYAEEYAPNNAMPWRNRSVRSVLRSDLTRHTPKPGMGIPTEYHNDNRNAKLRLSSPSFAASKESIASVSSTGIIAIDTANKNIYYSDQDTGGDTIRIDYDGNSFEQLDFNFYPYMYPDANIGKLFVVNGGIESGSTDAFGGFTAIAAAPGVISGLSGNPGIKLYFSDSSTDLIYSADLDGSGVVSIPTPALTDPSKIEYDSFTGKLFFQESTDRISMVNTDGTEYRSFTIYGGGFSDFTVDSRNGRIYYIDSTFANKIYTTNLDGGLLTPIGDVGSDGNSIAIDLELQKLFWWDGTISKANTESYKVFDNAFVTHAIPQASLRYRWIQDSALTTETQLPGYQHSSSVPFGPYDDIDYVLSSSDGRGDFIGISGTGLDKSGIAVQTPLGSDSTNFLSKSAGTIFNVYNGPYQYASWNQVRDGYNPIVIQLARESILSLANVRKTITNSLGRQVSSKRSDGVTNYKEPVVSDDSKPIVHQLYVRPDLGSPQQVVSCLKYTLANNLSTFTRKSIRNRLGIKSLLKGTLYEKLKNHYLDPDQVTQPGNPVSEFIEMDYSRILYPSPINAYLNQTRERTDYEEIVGTGSNGYDRIFGTQRTFYKSDQIRSEDAPNSQGNFVDTSVFEEIDKSYVFADSIGLDFLGDASSQIVTDQNNGSEAFVYGTVNASVSTRFLQWTDAFVTSSIALTDISMSLEATKGNYAITPAVTLESPDANEDLLIQYKSVATGTIWNTVATITPASLTAGTYTQTQVNFDPGEAVYIRIAQESFSGPNFDNYAIRNLRLIAAQSDVNKPALNFNSMATDGIRSFPESSSYRNYDGELMQDSDSTMFSTNPLPSLSYLELYNIRVGDSSSGYVERLTEQIAGKNSWYDTYDKYAADLRPQTKNRSIIPEFRMSENIPYYVVDKAADFRAPNKQVFTLDGASITSSADTRDALTFNSEFINRYVQTPNSGKFIQIAEDHVEGEVGQVSKVSFTCRGLKKLLPYNGFYPKDRAVQIGNVLSESLGGNVAGSFEGSTTSFPKQGWQGIVKPLMSPGILFNSIKSGIAVDYPIYTGSVPGFVQGTTNTPSDFQLDIGPNYRLPFETLYNLKGNLPQGEENPIRLVSAFITDEANFNTNELFNYKSVWSGEKTSLFELGMHNFLAETVDFFLEGEQGSSGGGKLTSFRSAPDNKWQEFEAGKSYYMDVILRDTVEMNKFIEYSGSGEIVENLKFGASDGALNDQFGYSVDTVEGGPGEGIYALVGSPNDTSAYLFQNKFDTTGWQQKQKLTASDGTVAGFASAVSIASGSDGIYMLVGDLNNTEAGLGAGAAYLYHSKSSEPFYIDSGGLTNQRWQTKITASDLAAFDTFGSDVSIDFGTDGVYMLISSLQTNGATGAAYLYHSKSSEPFYIDSGGLTNQRWQTKITASDGTGGDFLEGVSIVSGTDGVYMLVGAPGADLGGSNRGSSYLFHSKSSDPFYVDSVGATNQKWQTKITASDAADNDEFGRAVSAVSGTDGIYMVIGSARDDLVGSNEGSSYLFHSKSGETFYVDSAGATNQKWQTKLTASDAANSDEFGIAVSIVSGTDGIYTLIGAYLASSSLGEDAGKSYIFHSQSAGVAEQIMSASDGTANQFFGASVSLISSSVLPGDLYATMGATTASFAVSGSGAGYMFAGEFGSLSGTIGIQNVQQDYKQHGKLFGLGLGDVYDPAYAAYTPPMFYGASRARVKFTPSTTDTYTLDQVLKQATIEEIINVDSDRVATVNGFAKSLTSLQDQNRMPMSSSINMFGKFFEPGVTYNPQTGQATSIDQISNTNPAWVISTRFESPVLDMSSSKYNELYTAFAADSDMATSYNFYPGSINRTNPRTMWASYGKTPPQTKRVTMELAESFPNIIGNETTGSLIDQCGFTADDKSIGIVRGSKRIREAVVMIPYLDFPIDEVTTEIEGKHFILIDSEDTSRYTDQGNNLDQLKIAVQASENDGEKITKTTITRMIHGMKRFNIPPNMDFGSYDDIDPFVMYFFSFNHTLDRDDLSDIWQGVMPKPALKVEKDIINISHDINKFEFFGNINDRTLISKMKFFVFKAKQKAKQNYYDITEDATDDSRYTFNFAADGQQGAVPHPSYNWPYDYFSLVEDINIEAKYIIENENVLFSENEPFPEIRRKANKKKKKSD